MGLGEELPLSTTVMIGRLPPSHRYRSSGFGSLPTKSGALDAEGLSTLGAQTDERHPVGNKESKRQDRTAVIRCGPMPHHSIHRRAIPRVPHPLSFPSPERHTLPSPFSNALNAGRLATYGTYCARTVLGPQRYAGPGVHLLTLANIRPKHAAP